MTRVVLGIDPGLAALGYATVYRDKESLHLLDLGTVKTEKQKAKKAVIVTRVNVDDQARLRLLFDEVVRVMRHRKPAVMGVESYAPSGPNSNGWKAALAYGLVTGMAMTSDIQVIPHIPQDLKRKIAGKLSASKEEVQAALEVIYPSSTAVFKAMNKGDREHAADALGHAHLALLEVEALAAQVAGFV